MHREENIQDTDYIATLPRLYRITYAKWRERMLRDIEEIVESFRTCGVEQTMARFTLNFRDVALLVRLGYLTPQETEEFNLSPIEQSVPL